MRNSYFKIIFIIYFIITPQLFARPFSEIKSSGKLIIATTNDEINIIKDAAGSIMGGFNFNLAKAFAASQELAVEVKIINDFGQYFSIDRSGSDIRKDSSYIPYIFSAETADIAVDFITRTNWREKLFTMIPIIKNKQLLFSRASNTKKITNIKDLSGSNFILLKDSTYLESFEKIIKPIATSLNYSLEPALDLKCVESVMSGKFDYSIIDSITFLQYKRRYPELKKIFALGGEEELCWAVRTDNIELQNKFKNFLSEFKNSGEFHKMFRDYFLIPYFSYQKLLEPK